MKNAVSKMSYYILQREEIGIALTLVVIAAVFGIIKPEFLGGDNIMRLLLQASILGCMAIGIVYVISANGIDVSIGAILAVCATIVGQLVSLGFSVFLAVMASVAAGALMGFINGILITRLGIKDLIATFAMSYIIRGLLLQISGAKWLTNFPPQFTVIGQGTLLGIPVPILIVAVLLFAFTLFSTRTPIGKQVKAYGCNYEASQLSGVKVKRVKTLTYVICGVCTAFGSVIFAARMGAVQPNAGIGMEFEVISAALIGGASFSGEGSPIGAFLGVLLLTTIKNGLVLMGISPFMEGIITGLFILIALIINAFRGRFENSLEVNSSEKA